MATSKRWLGAVGTLVALTLAALLLWQATIGLTEPDDPALTEAIEQQLYQQYFPRQVAALSGALAAGNFGDALTMARDSSLTLHQLQAMQPLLRSDSPQTVVVKVRYSMNLGGSEGETVTRYMHFHHHLSGNRWRYQYDVNSLNFWLNLL